MKYPLFKIQDKHYGLMIALYVMLILGIFILSMILRKRWILLFEFVPVSFVFMFRDEGKNEET